MKLIAVYVLLIIGFCFPATMSAYVEGSVIANLYDRVVGIRIELEALLYKSLFPLTQSSSSTVATSSVALKLPTATLYSIGPSVDSFVKVKNRSRSSTSTMSAAPTNTGNLHEPDKSFYTTFAQGNAFPITINSSKNTYFVTSELPNDSVGQSKGFYSSRSEARVGVSAIEQNKDYYFTFDVFIDAASDLKSGNGWRLIQQIIEETAGKGPTLSLNLDTNENFVFVRRSDVDSYQELKKLPATKGVWHTFTYNFKLGAQGYVHIWHNGKSIYSDGNKTVYFTQCPKISTGTATLKVVQATNCSNASAKVGVYRAYTGTMGYNKLQYKNIALGSL